MTEWLQVDDHCAIDLDEVDVRFSRSGGPGGQHANKTSSRVELRFDVAASPSLEEWQRERLRARLAAGLRVERRRRPTRPSKGSKVRRLEAKRRQGERKRDRRKPDAGD